MRTILVTIAVLVGTACGGGGGGGAITPDNYTESPACTTFDDIPCVASERHEWDIAGTWTIADCTYTDATGDFVGMIGLSCEGAITLRTAGMDGELTYQDIGPNGTGIGDGFDAYSNARKNTPDPDTMIVYGTSTVMSQGCTSDVDVVFSCFGPASNGLYTCRKASALRSSDCDANGAAESFGHYTFQPM